MPPRSDQASTPERPLSHCMLERLTQFTQQNRLKCLLLTVAARHLSDDEVSLERGGGTLGRWSNSGRPPPPLLPALTTNTRIVYRSARCARSSTFATQTVTA